MSLIDITKIKLVLAFVLCVLISSCSSLSEPKYHGYFFQDTTNKNQKAFSYILYLGDIKDREVGKQGIGVITDTTKARRELRSSSRVEPKDGEADSLSFRMEEEAYKRLELKLTALNYCDRDVEYTSSNYDWLKYTIKGHCK